MSYSKNGVDLGLAISGALLKPGQCRTTTEMAAFAGCSKQNIEQLEKRALRKLRHRLMFGLHQGKAALHDLPGTNPPH